MSLLQEGQVIRETYEVERLIGEGAFAEVFRVKHAFFGRQAMKVFKMAGMTIEENRTVLEEAIWLSRIGHPNIVRVFEANMMETSQGERGFFTMEYVAGGSLDQFWRSHGARLIPISTVVEIIVQACRGIAIAHAEQPPIIHRDIKPQNILVGYDVGGLRALVSDFGLAKRANPLTLQVTVAGTPAFKPPEAFRDPKSDSCAADVWGLGSTLYLLLTDQLPYPERNLRGDISPEQALIPPSSLNIKADAALDRIVSKALALAPEDRHRTAAELLKDLEKWTPRSADALEPINSSGPSENSKSALGAHTSLDEHEARQMVAEAVELAGQVGELKEAADLMEEALNKWPGLRREHEYRLKVWRRGIVT